MPSTKHIVVLFFLVLLCNACSFNKMFYPTAYGKDAVFEKSLYEYEELFLETKNKKQIHCAQFKTKADTVKGQIVYFHGNAGSIATYQRVAEIFVRKGTTVF